MERFARLEEHDGMQVLAYVENSTDDNGNYGPCITYRTDRGISVHITTGAFEDSAEGWDAAVKAMNDIDFVTFAKTAKQMAEKFIEEG